MKLFKCYFNYGYSSDLGKHDESWHTLCEGCLGEYPLSALHDFKISPAVPDYEGHKPKCVDCGKYAEGIE